MAVSVALPFSLVRNSTFSLGSFAKASLVGAKMVTRSPLGSSSPAAFTSDSSVVRPAFSATVPSDAPPPEAEAPKGRTQSTSKAKGPSFLSASVKPIDSTRSGRRRGAPSTSSPKLYNLKSRKGISSVVHSPAVVSNFTWKLPAISRTSEQRTSNW